MPTKKQRSSGVELLRIICMLQVVFLHVADHGGYTDAAQAVGGKTELIYWFLAFVSRCPVYIFILISGYFSSTGEVLFNKSKLIKTYLPMLFYSVTIPLVVHFSGLGTVSSARFIKGLFPLLSRTWYFMTLYFLLMLIAPFLNRMIRGLSRKEYLYLLGIMFFLLSVWQFAAKSPEIKTVVSVKNVIATEGGKSMYDFIFMYLIGGFLRHHSLFKKPVHRFWYLWTFIFCGVLNVMLLYAWPKSQHVLMYNDNPLCVVQCVCLFQLFRSFEFTSKTINSISALNIGIYMFHDHPLMRKIIWNVFDVSDPAFYEKPYYLLVIVLIVLAVFTGSGVVEWLRQRLFEVVEKAYRSRLKA